MRLKQYFAITNNGKSHKLEARFYDEALKMAIHKFGHWLVSVIEADEVVDSDFLKLVTGKFAEGANKQEVKGIEKYGVPLNPMDNYDWLNMAEEELIDGYKYLVAERTRRDAILKEIVEDINNMKNGLEYAEGGEAYIEMLNAIEAKLRKLSKNI